METKICRECGVLLQPVRGSSLCNYCEPKDEEIFQKVKAYIKENPGATTADVCRATGVTVRQIRNYLEEGRLSSSG